MWPIVFERAIVWSVLIVAVVAGAAAGQRWGKWALVGVFVLVWPILLFVDVLGFMGGVPQLLELNSPTQLFRRLWPAATIGVIVVLIPMLFVLKAGSLRKLIYWGLGSATIAIFLLPILALVVALTIPSRHVCNLPSLEAAIPSQTTVEVGTSGLFSDTCPVTIAREFEFEREYGVIRMFWWGSPHRLYMVANTTDGRALEVSGSRVEEYRGRGPGSFLGEYSSRVTFAGQNYVGIPAAESFTINVSFENGDLIEQIELEYVPKQCTCAVYDGP